MAQKILVCGFPHSGTSILKSILGHIEDVEEIYDECSVIHKTSHKKFILCKSPFTNEIFFSDNYKDYIKIFIIRNPLFIFSSLNKRFNYNIPDDHSFNAYIKTLNMFRKYKNNTGNGIYTIRYEDLFENDYEKLKNILNSIGINYHDNIFDNSHFTNVIVVGQQLVNEKPANREHAAYRTWQINKPFVSNNDTSKIDLTDEQKKQIMNNHDVLQIYPDITSNTA